MKLISRPFKTNLMFSLRSVARSLASGNLDLFLARPPSCVEGLQNLIGGWCQTLHVSLGLMIASDRNDLNFTVVRHLTCLSHVCFCHFVTKRCFKHLSNGMNPGNCLKMPKLIPGSMPKLAELITRQVVTVEFYGFQITL